MTYEIGDGHYWKYRVFREPAPTGEIDHPVPIKAEFLDYENQDEEVWGELQEVDGHFFVLRPEDDHHARVAMAAYAFSVRSDRPLLASDIMEILSDIDYEVEVGAEPNFEEGGSLRDNVVEFFRRSK